MSKEITAVIPMSLVYVVRDSRDDAGVGKVERGFYAYIPGERQVVRMVAGPKGILTAQSVPPKLVREVLEFVDKFGDAVEPEVKQATFPVTRDLPDSSAE